MAAVIRIHTCLNEIIHQPSLADLRRMFLALDAEGCSTLCLDCVDRHMVIGGGAGQYIIYVSPLDEFDAEFWNLLADKGERGKVLLKAGGQVGDYPLRQIVDRVVAQRAAETFFETGETDSSLLWERG